MCFHGMLDLCMSFCLNRVTPGNIEQNKTQMHGLRFTQKLIENCFRISEAREIEALNMLSMGGGSIYGPLPPLKPTILPLF